MPGTITGSIRRAATLAIRRQLALMYNDPDSQKDPHLFIELWNNGWSASKLARYYNMTERGIRKRIRRYRQLGWVVRTVNKSAAVLLIIVFASSLAHALPPCATYIQPDCDQVTCIGAWCLYAGPNDSIDVYSNVTGKDMGVLWGPPIPTPAATTTINITPIATATATPTPSPAATATATGTATATLTITPTPAPAATPIASLVITKAGAIVTCQYGGKTWQPVPVVTPIKRTWTCIPH